MVRDLRRWVGVEGGVWGGELLKADCRKRAALRVRFRGGIRCNAQSCFCALCFVMKGPVALVNAESHGIFMMGSRDLYIQLRLRLVGGNKARGKLSRTGKSRYMLHILPV
jgi:hypothetical protein